MSMKAFLVASTAVVKFSYIGLDSVILGVPFL